MSDERTDGGPAFPQPEWNGSEVANCPWPFGFGGMTLRDYFAAAALAGLVYQEDYNAVAEMAYDHADAMLAERGKHERD